MSRLYTHGPGPKFEETYHEDQVVSLEIALSRGSRGYYQRELLTQQTILQNTLDKLFSETLPNELQDDAGVVKLWNDLNQPIIGPECARGPRGPRTKAGRQLQEYLGDDFVDLVDDLKGLLKGISSLIKTKREKEPVKFDVRARAGELRLDLERGQQRSSSLENGDLETVLSNIRKSRERVLKVAAHYQESFARGRSGNDTASVTSVETEVGCALKTMFSSAKSLQSTSGEPALSFLSVTISSTFTSPHLSEKALLDTGATASCISEELASKLRLITTPSDKEVVWTASKEQKIFHNGETKLKLKWKNRSGEFERVKVIVYVVPGLALNLILSHKFTRNHPNVWDVAETTGMLYEHVAVLGFGRLSKEQRAAEETFEQDHTQVNRDKDREMMDAERAELEKRLGISAGNSSARSGERSGIDTSSITESQSSTGGRSL